MAVLDTAKAVVVKYAMKHSAFTTLSDICLSSSAVERVLGKNEVPGSSPG